jgi:hypothetical protein
MEFKDFLHLDEKQRSEIKDLNLATQNVNMSQFISAGSVMQI